MAISDIMASLDAMNDSDCKKQQDRIIEALGGFRKMIKLCISKTETISNKESQQLLSVLKNKRERKRNKTSIAIR